jgi:hypothetical protein
VRLGVAEVERIHHHADIGGVLAGLTQMRDLNQFEGGSESTLCNKARYRSGPLSRIASLPGG